MKDLRLRARHGEDAASPQVFVPVTVAPIHLRCGMLGRRPVVAVMDNAGGLAVFIADIKAGSVPVVLRLQCGTKLTGGLAVLSKDGDSCPDAGAIYAGDSSGHIWCWHVSVTGDGNSLMTQGNVVQCVGAQRDTATDLYIPYEAGERPELAIVDIDANCEAGVLSAGVDGCLDRWQAAEGAIDSKIKPWLCSIPTARRDCSEVPTLCGAKWVPLGSVHCCPQAPEQLVDFSCADDRAHWLQMPDWKALPSEIVCRKVFPFASLRELALTIASISVGHRVCAEQEVMREGRAEQLALALSDCTAWLLDPHLRVLARQDLPFCAAQSISCVVPGSATVLIAPKTDLVAIAGPGIAVMPHVWALTCVRRRGGWKMQLHVRRINLRPSDNLAVAAVDPTTGAGLDQNAFNAAAHQESQQQRRVVEDPAVAREPTHALGLAVSDTHVWAVLTNGELLLFRVESGLASLGCSRSC
jgi:hypothetical protein